MAANEHKNLNDINRHNPKGFETATNNTVLGKSLGTSATGTDGNLHWQDKSLIGSTTHKMQGYALVGEANYMYGEAVHKTTPSLIDVDSGSDTIASITITPNEFFQMALGRVVPETGRVVLIKGWAASSGANAFTVALCKITPVADNTSDVAVVGIKEIGLTGLSSEDKLIFINETTFASAGDEDISAGDIIFPMIKESGEGGSEIYINLTIKTTVY